MEQLKEFLQLDFSAVIISIFLIMSTIIAGYEIIGKFSKLINKPVKWVRNKDDDHKLLLETVEKVNQYYENRVNDREQSFGIQKELTDAQKELTKSLSDISKKIDKMQQNTDKRFEENEKKHNKRVRAELKDKIGQTYRYHHTTGKINDIELEALEDLIEEYEAADGENSFVHSLVQKEMYTWEKVERN